MKLSSPSICHYYYQMKNGKFPGNFFSKRNFFFGQPRNRLFYFLDRSQHTHTHTFTDQIRLYTLKILCQSWLINGNKNELNRNYWIHFLIVILWNFWSAFSFSFAFTFTFTLFKENGSIFVLWVPFSFKILESNNNNDNSNIKQE